MSVFKKEIDVYQDIYDRMISSFNTFTFKDVEEKNMVIGLLKNKINDLKRIDNYCDYWRNRDNSDWEDPRL